MEEDKLLELVKNSLANLNKKEKYAIAFSGGIDSTVLAKVMLDMGFSVRGYVVGMKNAHDIQQAKKSAMEIGLSLKIIEISEKEVDESMKI